MGDPNFAFRVVMLRCHAASMDAPPVPSADEWAALGLTVIEELHGGFQSRVVRVDRDGESFVVKLTDRRYADEAFFARLTVLDTLAASEPLAVGPIRIGGSVTVELGAWCAVAYPFIEGRGAEPTDRTDVAAMARTLATLHRSLRQIDATPNVPPVATLRAVAHDPAAFANGQLLHGRSLDRAAQGHTAPAPLRPAPAPQHRPPRLATGRKAQEWLRHQQSR